MGRIARVLGYIAAGCGGIAVAVLSLLWIAAMIRERDDRPPPGMTVVATPIGGIAAATGGPVEGRAVLIIPGTAGWSGFWRDISAHLAARGFHVVAADLPPFGYSPRDPLARYDRTAQAIRLAALLRATTNRPAIVIGHSFGAGAATELALRSPDLVEKLVLVDAALGTLDPAPGKSPAERLIGLAPIGQAATAATVTNPWLTGRLLRSLLARKDMAAPWLDTVRLPMRRPGTTAAYAAWLPALLARDDGALSRRSAALTAIRPRVALIWGEADTVTPIAQGVMLSRLMRAQSLARLPGIGHIPHIEDPPAFMAALDAATGDAR